MPNAIRRIIFVQLPVPPPGPQAMEGNVPLAAALIKLYARRQGLERDFEIDVFPPELANTLGDQALFHAIEQRRPDMIGFTCYVWNIERSLWLAEQIKRERPEVKIILGGPEITEDNRWVLDHEAVDYAVFGEGEATFAELLQSFRESNGDPGNPIAGLWRKTVGKLPDVREMLASLDGVSSPYLEGILDATSNKTLLLETVRGCRFQCKYCYYSKRHTVLRYLSYEQIEANLQYAIEHGVREVYLLDPTINQRPDFVEFLQLLARCNVERQLTFSGELRAEGIDGEKAKLLKTANFAELEIGLQSVEPLAHRRMGRPVNLDAWQRGVRALMAEGICARLDLILGLPGDDLDSVRRGIDYLAQFRPQAEIQIFNLSILPGTEFRQEAVSLGIKYQAKPPYYVLNTPTLDVVQMFSLMEEAQQTLGIEFDAPSIPFADEEADDGIISTEILSLNLDDDTAEVLTEKIGLVTILRLRSVDFSQVKSRTVQTVADVVRTNPHVTLQIVLEPLGSPDCLQPEHLEEIAQVCYSSTSYLDRYYSLHPGLRLAAKRLFVLLPVEERMRLAPAWIEEIGGCANILWHGDEPPTLPLEEFEHWIRRPGL